MGIASNMKIHRTKQKERRELRGNRDNEKLPLISFMYLLQEAMGKFTFLK